MTAIKLLMLSDYMTAPLTGVGRYSFEIASRMALRKNDVNLHFSSYRGIERWRDIQRRANAPVIESSLGRQLGGRMIESTIGSKCLELLQLTNQRRLLREIGKNTIIHAPSLQVLTPRTDSTGARVLTVHDLSHIVAPSWHPKRRVLRIERALRDVQNFDRVIAVSNYTKDALVKQFKIDPHRVIVVSNGIGDSYIHAAPGLGKRSHSLCVSTIEPRKNIDTLISAYASLPRAIRFEYPLILVGSSGWNSDATRLRIRSFQAEGWLHYFGYTDAAELGKLYADAKLCIYPSKYEGFGLPVLEGLATGCRVIAGNHSSITEVAGGRARLLADITDVDELRTAILAELSLPWRVGEEAGRAAYARTFTWDVAAAQTLDVYRDALATR